MRASFATAGVSAPSAAAEAMSGNTGCLCHTPCRCGCWAVVVRGEATARGEATPPLFATPRPEVDNAAVGGDRRGLATLCSYASAASSRNRASSQAFRMDSQRRSTSRLSNADLASWPSSPPKVRRFSGGNRATAGAAGPRPPREAATWAAEAKYIWIGTSSPEPSSRSSLTKSSRLLVPAVPPSGTPQRTLTFLQSISYLEAPSLRIFSCGTDSWSKARRDAIIIWSEASPSNCSAENGLPTYLERIVCTAEPREGKL
mmetsp:Transcript_266/g.753  ORF Transcript_266/g.753 Transcript_266/m.753 type:complete len:259 (+) Transcript_266:290-1066(+)